MVFDANEGLFDKFIWLNTLKGSTYTCFWWILKTASLKIKLWKQQPIPGRLAKETQALSWNFSICISNVTKDEFGLLFFRKREDIPHQVVRKRIVQYVNFLWGFCAIPWYREIRVKTLSLTTKTWELAGLTLVNWKIWMT